MEKKARAIIPVKRILLFLFIGLFITVMLSGIFSVKWTKYEDYYSLEENSLDYITLGASHCLYSLNPMYVYSQTKIKGYNMADEAQSVEFSYYWLKEALKKQKPKLVFIDVGNLFYDEAYMNEYWKMKEFAGMHFSLDKVKDIWSSFGNLPVTVGAVFPLFYFHERWKELGKNDFEPDPGRNFGSNLIFHVNGDDTPDTVNLFEKESCIEGEGRNIENEISDKNWSYFIKISSLCDENGIRLVPVKFPTNAWDDQRSEIVREKINELGLYMTDLNQRVPGINWGTDSFDEGYHTNYWGNIKTSDAFCSILQEELEMEQRADDMDWNERVKRYSELENEMLISGQDKRDNYWKWLSGTKGEDNLILLCLNGKITGDISEIDYRLRQLGLSGYAEDEKKNSYAAVIDGDDIVFESWSSRIIEYEKTIGEGCTIRLVSSGNKSHIGTVSGKAQILINGKDYAEGSAGINIVVYNKAADVVLSSVTQYNSDSWNLEAENALPEDPFDLNSTPAGYRLYTAEKGTVIQDISAEYAGSGTYYILNSEGRYLAVVNGGTAENTPVLWRKFSGTAVQRWMFKDNCDGTCSLVSLYNHKYLGIGINQLFTASAFEDKQLILTEPQ